MANTIAGHLFGPNGRCVYTQDDGRRTCGMCFSDIAGATEENIDNLGWAHVGKLSRIEYTEIVAERDRLYMAHMAQRGE